MYMLCAQYMSLRMHTHDNSSHEGRWGGGGRPRREIRGGGGARREIGGGGYHEGIDRGDRDRWGGGGGYHIQHLLSLDELTRGEINGGCDAQ